MKKPRDDDRPEIPALFQVGDILSWSLGSKPFLLLEWKFDTWPSWESLGRYVQWRVFWLEEQRFEWVLENSMNGAHVVAFGALPERKAR